jgi:hypothetical protein
MEIQWVLTMYQITSSGYDVERVVHVRLYNVPRVSTLEIAKCHVSIGACGDRLLAWYLPGQIRVAARCSIV